MTTARDITKAMRGLHPSPVRMSVKAGPGKGQFLLQLPSMPASWYTRQAGREWLGSYLTRHLPGVVVRVDPGVPRPVLRRDCSMDYEISLQVA